jgi:hypothetical protein
LKVATHVHGTLFFCIDITVVELKNNNPGWNGKQKCFIDLLEITGNGHKM